MNRKDQLMEQPGPEPRPEQPDRADGPRRAPRLPRRDAQARPRRDAEDWPGGPEPPMQVSREDLPAQPPAARDPGHPVVIGFDGSPSSRNALAYAVGLARRLGRPLLVVYVVPFGVYCEPMTGQVICAMRERGDLEPWLLAELNQICDSEGLEVRVMARRGNAARELAATADSSSADALVVGASGHPLRHVAGSIPSWLARHARCPVIVVP
jgi:nucleotide-binding universal stress UspA family protein